MAKTAVILMNLGGPADLNAVRPFLFNLFHDPHIIQLPQPLRWMVAQLISRFRAKTAREIYRSIGGGSPLKANTKAQAQALEDYLKDMFSDGDENHYQVFVAMRYTPPSIEETVKQVISCAPDHVVLLPLYPQYSTTTTLSSLQEWEQQARRQGLQCPTSLIHSYPELSGLVDVYAQNIQQAVKKWSESDRRQARFLFSAHGLPMKVVRQGDPYPTHVTCTVRAVEKALHLNGFPLTEDQVVICFQSRVGPMAWLAPSTEDKILEAGREKRPIVLIPISFVSEHSETLYELDQEYKDLAEASGVPLWARIHTPGDHPVFIAGLAQLVRTSVHEKLV